VNPGVDAGTHPHIATGDHDDKFGVPLAEAAELARHAAILPGISLHGLAVHIGSQLVDLDPLGVALDHVLELHDSLVDAGLNLVTLDAGGGLGVRYRDETPPSPADYAALLSAKTSSRKLRVTVEPGRSLVADCGVLLARVELIKHGERHAFVVTDAGMSELLRPALYDAWHPIEVIGGHGDPFHCEVVGPLCESGDVLGSGRTLAAHAGDLLAVGMAGAYGASMSSHYNARPLAAEVLVGDGEPRLIRNRETIPELWRNEVLS
jgi:diaminopimelate decarboxylase